MSAATLITADQLLEMPDNRWCELDGGEHLPGFRYPIADLFVNP